MQTSTSNKENAALIAGLLCVLLAVVGFRYLPMLYAVHPWLAATAAVFLVGFTSSAWGRG